VVAAKERLKGRVLAEGERLPLQLAQRDRRKCDLERLRGERGQRRRQPEEQLAPLCAVAHRAPRGLERARRDWPQLAAQPSVEGKPPPQLLERRFTDRLAARLAATSRVAARVAAAFARRPDTRTRLRAAAAPAGRRRGRGGGEADPEAAPARALRRGCTRTPPWRRRRRRPRRLAGGRNHSRIGRASGRLFFRRRLRGRRRRRRRSRRSWAGGRACAWRSEEGEGDGNEP